MRIYLFSLLLSLFSCSNLFGQHELSLSTLPIEIQRLLFDDPKKFNYVDSMEFEEVEPSRMMRWIDTFGIKNYRYWIRYNLVGVKAELFICQADSNFYISEYDYLLWTSIFDAKPFSGTLVLEKVKAKVISEIDEHCFGVSKVEFNATFGDQLYDGHYHDEILKKKKNSFSFRLALFESRSPTNLIKKYYKMINIKDLKASYFDYYAFFCFYGRASSTDKNGKLDLSMERYRRILFDPISFKLESDAIISPVVHLIECP